MFTTIKYYIYGTLKAYKTYCLPVYYNFCTKSRFWCLIRNNRWRVELKIKIIVIWRCFPITLAGRAWFRAVSSVCLWKASKSRVHIAYDTNKLSLATETAGHERKSRQFQCIWCVSSNFTIIYFSIDYIVVKTGWYLSIWFSMLVKVAINLN